ncbi:peptidase U32 family protein [Allofustis seminis]|uniref:peptidase U32 family protein n=1 Tax=Allofustis seminis TaxID=166939 RepID=UPI00036A0011|nr:U32 family peptidase [Allofustis seminis]
MTKILKKPEILCPGGTLEKLKIAIRYGADACYIAGTDFGLRTRAGNFDEADMKEAVAFAHAHNAKVYVVANMVTHEGNEEGAASFFRQIEAVGVDAVLISDPALMAICHETTPELPIHLSTQASAVNYETLNFWAHEGLERVVLGREASLAEIKRMKEKTTIEIECFMHGAMCIGYSGRCALSSYMARRDANRGGCAQPCRWLYDLMAMDEDGTMTTIGPDQALETEIPFSMSAVDLTMIEHIPDLVEAGVDSLKIEGRMKSIHYVSTVANVYRIAIDAYCEDPQNYELKQDWVDELWKVAQRELATGFFYQKPGAHEQLYDSVRRPPKDTFIGQVLNYDHATGIATIQQRNKFAVGDEIEFYGPGMRHAIQTVKWMENEMGERIQDCPHALMTIKIPVEFPVERYDLIRQAHVIEKVRA